LETITLVGTDFATPQYFDNALVGSYALLGCNITVNHLRIVCKTPPGVGRGLSVTVKVEGLTSGASLQLVDYRAPNVTALFYLPSCVSSTDCSSGGDGVDPVALPTEGGVIAMAGTDFGGRFLGMDVVAGLEPATKALWSVPYEETCVDLPVPVPPGAYCVLIDVPPGDGRNRALQVLAGDQASAVLSFSFADPDVQLLIVQQALFDRTSNVVVMRGRNFGLSGHVLVSTAPNATSEEVWLTYLDEVTPGFAGNRTVVECRWDAGVFADGMWSHTEVRCLMPPLRGVPIIAGSVALQVGVDNRLAVAQHFEQLSPTILWMSFNEAGTSLRPTLTIIAQYVELLGLLVTIGNRTCELSSFVELMDPVADGSGSVSIIDSGECPPSGICLRTEKRGRIRCVVPRGEGRNNDVVVSLNDRKSESFKFHFRPPMLRANATVTGWGESFGGWPTQGSVATGYRATVWGACVRCHADDAVCARVCVRVRVCVCVFAFLFDCASACSISFSPACLVLACRCSFRNQLRPEPPRAHRRRSIARERRGVRPGRCQCNAHEPGVHGAAWVRHAPQRDCPGGEPDDADADAGDVQLCATEHHECVPDVDVWSDDGTHARICCVSFVT
jgi:hypothetical protein